MILCNAQTIYNVKNQCVDPCSYRDTCAPEANCKVVGNKAICTCPSAFTGNPDPYVVGIFVRIQTFLDEQINK